MGNLKTLFINKFREKELPIVSHKENWSKILGAILGMKNVYYRNQNINLVNSKQRAGKRIYLFWLLYKFIKMNYYYDGFMLVMFILF